jgi:SAM-dependent methyltransferase
MKELLKRVLKRLNAYHFLQSTYRGAINSTKKKLFQISYAKYKGKGFICNVCGCRYEKFVHDYPSPEIARAINENEVIAGYGNNVFCPNCMSKNRERLLIAVLQDLVSIKNTSILLFSPEKNIHTFLKSHASVTTVDIEPEFYRPVDPTIQFADATNLSFKDESFDVVIANHVLEHIPEDFKAMQEFYRVLKKGGFAILQVPFSEKILTTKEDPYINNPAEQQRLYGQKDHVRIYSLNDYVRRLEKENFKVEILSADFLKQFAHHAIQEKECVIIGRK